jgi:hypothetical protein
MNVGKDQSTTSGAMIEVQDALAPDAMARLLPLATCLARAVRRGRLHEGGAYARLLYVAKREASPLDLPAVRREVQAMRRRAISS